MDDALSTSMHVMRCAMRKALNNTPGAVAFRRDMLIDIPVLVNLEMIRQQRQAAIDINLLRQNVKQYDYNYAVGGP